jgi:hypothetical protein
VIDDTPASMKWIPAPDHDTALSFKEEFGMLPGTGAFYNEALAGIDFRVIHHDYNLVLSVK